jgi:hypothetical protein
MQLIGDLLGRNVDITIITLTTLITTSIVNVTLFHD